MSKKKKKRIQQKHWKELAGDILAAAAAGLIVEIIKTAAQWLLQ